VVVETYVFVMTFRVILPFVNVLSSPIPCKWFKTNPIAPMITINALIHWTPTNMSPNIDFVNMDYFGHPI
jgi:hypothetical protein